jgi:DNA-binding NarL/FixJ family response regulator
MSTGSGAQGPTALIVDDHPLFRDALAAALAQAFPDGATAVQAGSIAAALDALKSRKVDLVLLDLNVSDASAFDGLTRIAGVAGAAPIYVVSATETPDAYRKAKALGASGYLPKSLPPEELSAAFVTALDGGEWFPQSLGEADDDEAVRRVASLTPAQSRVISGLSSGLLNKQIAYEMGISEATVKAHMTAIFRKLGAFNRMQALLIYRQATALADHSAA